MMDTELPDSPSPCAAAAVALIWVKDPSGEGEAGTFDENNYVAITSSTLVAVMLALTAISMVQMFFRLHTQTPTNSSLTLSTGKGNSYSNVHEFYVGAGSDVRQKGPPPGAVAPDERSKLLPGLPP